MFLLSMAAKNGGTKPVCIASICELRLANLIPNPLDQHPDLVQLASGQGDSFDKRPNGYARCQGHTCSCKFLTAEVIPLKLWEVSVTGPSLIMISIDNDMCINRVNHVLYLRILAVIAARF